MEPQCSRGEQERRPQGGDQRGGQQPAVVHQPEGDHLHLESVLGGHAAEDALPQGHVHGRTQDAEVPGEQAGVVLDAVVLLPAVGGVEGAHRAREEDRGVSRNHHLSGRSFTLLQRCQDKQGVLLRKHSRVLKCGLCNISSYTQLCCICRPEVVANKIIFLLTRTFIEQDNTFLPREDLDIFAFQFCTCF